MLPRRRLLLTKTFKLMNTQLKKFIESLQPEVKAISAERMAVLQPIIEQIFQRLHHGKRLSLNYVCTHNSRRSHMGQFGAWAAAEFLDMAPYFDFYSGGTEVTAIHPHSVEALTDAGFIIKKTSEGNNPKYEVRLSEGWLAKKVLAFSKTYDDESNPKKDFIAIMVCGSADANCPFVAGALARIVTTYEDPKLADDWALAERKAHYTERLRQITAEQLYIFSQAKIKLGWSHKSSQEDFPFWIGI